MAFMIPEYTCEPFVVVELANGETETVPAEYFDEQDFDTIEEIERVEGKWWARLSAPGYLDATDWSGPFDTEDEARAEIEEMWEVDPDTGDDLPEGGE